MLFRSLPDYDVQCNILSKIKNIQKGLYQLKKLKASYIALSERELSVDYTAYQEKQVPIKKCLDYISGSSQLTEEKNYQRLKNRGVQHTLLTGATEKARQYVMVSEKDNINRFSGKEGLLVTRKGKAGHIEYLRPDHYIINDDAYILYIRNECKYKIDLIWLSIQYRRAFYRYASNSDNGTWNMTGFFSYTKIDIPCYDEQLSLVKKHQLLQNRITAIEQIEEQYTCLISKEIA